MEVGFVWFNSEIFIQLWRAKMRIKIFCPIKCHLRLIRYGLTPINESFSSSFHAFASILYARAHTTDLSSMLFVWPVDSISYFFVVFTQLFNFLQLSMNQRQQYNIRLLRRVYTCGLRMRFWPINQSTNLALFVLH